MSLSPRRHTSSIALFLSLISAVKRYLIVSWLSHILRHNLFLCRNCYILNETLQISLVEFWIMLCSVSSPGVVHLNFLVKFAVFQISFGISNSCPQFHTEMCGKDKEFPWYLEEISDQKLSWLKPHMLWHQYQRGTPGISSFWYLHCGILYDFRPSTCEPI